MAAWDYFQPKYSKEACPWTANTKPINHFNSNMIGSHKNLPFEVNLSFRITQKCKQRIFCTQSYVHLFEWVSIHVTWATELGMRQRWRGWGKYGLPWKPAVQCGWPADQVEVACFVDGEGLVDIAMRVNISCHGAIQRETKWGDGGREEA